MPQLSPIASALDRCLTLMDRAAPHPDDRHAWHTTQRIAALLRRAHDAMSRDEQDGAVLAELLSDMKKEFAHA